MEIKDDLLPTLFTGNLLTVIQLQANYYGYTPYLVTLMELGKVIYPCTFQAVATSSEYTQWSALGDEHEFSQARRNATYNLFKRVLRELAAAGFTMPGSSRWCVTIKQLEHAPEVYDVWYQLKEGDQTKRYYPDATMGLSRAFEKLTLVAELLSNGYNPNDLGIIRND